MLDSQARAARQSRFTVISALFFMATIVLCFVGSLIVADRFGFLARAPLELDPATLDFEARSLLADIGYTETPVDVESGWLCCDAEARQYLEGLSREQRNVALAAHRPPVIQYVYRQHQDDFRLGPVTYDDPPNVEPGMIQVRLDARGRLLGLAVEPWVEDAEAGSSIGPETINRLFEAAGADRARPDSGKLHRESCRR